MNYLLRSQVSQVPQVIGKPNFLVGVAQLGQCRFASGHNATADSPQQPERTALYDFHVEQGGKIVNFGGFALPVQYADQGITASHLHTRRHASIFDVSHMLQTYVRGKDAIACMESVCTADIRGATDGTGGLTVFTSSNGGILDDLIVTKVTDRLLYVVSNAAMKAQDMGIMSAAVAKSKSDGKDVAIEFLPPSEQSLIALQGPKAVSALATLLPGGGLELDQLFFMNTMVGEVAGVPNIRITRCGYTGEDGVEISIPSKHVRHVAESLLAAKDQQVKMAGLGARDSLRLEAGLCLYGSDIDANTTPVEAALTWLIAKSRRTANSFPGAQHILDQLQTGVTRRRVGLHMLGTGVPPARAGTQILHDGQQVGHITSGCPSPSLGKNIAMGYVKEELKAPGTPVQLKIRDRIYEAEIAKMPFTKSNYFTKPKK